ncbi:hypothetical protein [Kordiimonas sp.]|uniref:hypothetical protein n=1 Tax=Kordiimonas sp. TaxID=1970157 RepID=UPI003A959BBC
MSDDHKRHPEWDLDMLYAFEAAAELIDQEEFGGDNADRQKAAYQEVAKRIRAMGKRYEKKMDAKECDT